MSENQLKSFVLAVVVGLCCFLGYTFYRSWKSIEPTRRMVERTAVGYFPEGSRLRCFRHHSAWRCSDGRTLTMDCTENLCWPLCGVSR